MTLRAFFFSLLFVSLNALGQVRYIDYPSPFHPTIGNSGMVVSQNQASSDIGVEILNMGGNAIDAAVAVGFSLAITLPRAGNIGGGGFMLVYLNDEKKLLPCAVQLNGEYNVDNVYAGVPVIIGKDGVEKIEQIDLDEKEKKEFMHSIDAVKALWEAAAKIDPDLSK